MLTAAAMVGKEANEKQGRRAIAKQPPKRIKRVSRASKRTYWHTGHTQAGTPSTCKLAEIGLKCSNYACLTKFRLRVVHETAK